MSDLHLALKAEYFDDIKRGDKPFEYRLYNDYWIKRLARKGVKYDRIIITKGYPKRGDPDRTIIKPYLGYTIARIKHPHFGNDAVYVFAIDVRGPLLPF